MKKRSLIKKKFTPVKNMYLNRKGNKGKGKPYVWDAYASKLSRGMHVISRRWTALLRIQSVLVQRGRDKKVIGRIYRVIDWYLL